MNKCSLWFYKVWDNDKYSINYGTKIINETKAYYTSINPYQLLLIFTLSLQLKIIIKANYNQ